MVQFPYSLHKRKIHSKPGYIYYVQFWNATRKKYATAQSISSLIKKLNLDLKEYNPSNKNSSRLVVQKWLIKLPNLEKTNDPKFCDFLENFWDWDTSLYIKNKLAHDKNSIGKAYVKANLSWIKRYVRPKFPNETLGTIKSLDLEKFFLDLHESGMLQSHTINLIMQAIRVPLTDAFLHHSITINPMAHIKKFKTQHIEKGILTDEEVTKLISLKWPDYRQYCAFLLGLVNIGRRVPLFIGGGVPLF